MKTTMRLLAFVFIVVATQSAYAIAAYYTTIFAPGNTLFTPQLAKTHSNLNTLFPHPIGIMPSYFAPEGTTISLWDAPSETFNIASTYSGGVWSIDLTLQVGTGYLLNTFAVFTNMFTGSVLSHDGSLLIFIEEPIPPPPVYTGPNGIYLLGDKTIISNTGTDIFLNILGRQPNIGEQVMTLTSTNTYLGGGSWIGGVPVLYQGQAAFLNIGPVPEPSTVAIGALGLVLIHVNRRRRH